MNGKQFLKNIIWKVWMLSRAALRKQLARWSSSLYQRWSGRRFLVLGSTHAKKLISESNDERDWAVWNWDILYWQDQKFRWGTTKNQWLHELDQVQPSWGSYFTVASAAKRWSFFELKSRTRWVSRRTAQDTQSKSWGATWTRQSHGQPNHDKITDRLAQPTFSSSTARCDVLLWG